MPFSRKNAPQKNIRAGPRRKRRERNCPALEEVKCRSKYISAKTLKKITSILLISQEKFMSFQQRQKTATKNYVFCPTRRKKKSGLGCGGRGESEIAQPWKK